jgi:hypothetical protein
METIKEIKWVVLLCTIFVVGCFDLELLDNMVPMDTETEEGAASGNGETAPADSDGPGRAPETDPTDTAAPSISAESCAYPGRRTEGACVVEGAVSASIRFSTDEPAVVGVTASEGIRYGVLSSEWEHAHWVVVAGLATEASSSVTVSVTDVNGNQSEQEISLLGSGGPAIVITEVLADPFGPEPAQEFVEVMNLGPESVDLSFWMVDDNNDANGDLIAEGTVLGPGKTALLVADAFDPLNSADPMPDPDADIVYLETSIGSNGLKNSEAESVELYDSTGKIVCRYAGDAGAPEEGLSVHRLLAEIPEGVTGAFNPEQSEATPGVAPTLF